MQKQTKEEQEKADREEVRRLLIHAGIITPDKKAA
jgi:hypothetical protein